MPPLNRHITRLSPLRRGLQSSTRSPRLNSRPYATVQTTPVATQHFWTANRAILFASFASSLAYFAGAYDVWSGTRKEGQATAKAVDDKPVYANKKELEQVIYTVFSNMNVGLLLIASKGIAELRGILGEDAISTDDEDLFRHGFSEWSSVNIDTLPVAIAYPHSTEDVVKIVKVCSQSQSPKSPQTATLNLSRSAPNTASPRSPIRAEPPSKQTSPPPSAACPSTLPTWTRSSPFIPPTWTWSCSPPFPGCH